jgi:hypothetical protein
MRLAGHVARIVGRINTYSVLVRKRGGKRLLVRPRRRWNDNIKTDFQEVECGGMDWIDLAQDRNRWWVLLNAVLNLWLYKMRGIS